MTTVGTRLPPVLLGALVLHVAVLSQLRVLGVAAELLLLVAIAAGIVAGPQRGAVVGFAAGILADLVVLTPFGLSALVGTVVGWAVGHLHVSVLRDAWWIAPVLAAVASAAGVVAFALGGALLGHEHLVGGRLPVVVVVVAVLNGALSPLAVRALEWALVARRPGDVLLR